MPGYYSESDCGKLDEEKLLRCFRIFIFDDPRMRENDMLAIIRRVQFVFGDTTYRRRVDESDKRWMDDEIGQIFMTILDFLQGIGKRE